MSVRALAKVKGARITSTGFLYGRIRKMYIYNVNNKETYINLKGEEDPSNYITGNHCLSIFIPRPTHYNETLERAGHAS